MTVLDVFIALLGRAGENNGDGIQRDKGAMRGLGRKRDGEKQEQSIWQGTYFMNVRKLPKF
jgi:hypothetical protein